MRQFNNVALDGADIRDEGFEAAFNGETDADCPYELGTDDAMNWIDGWTSYFDVQEDIERQNNKALRFESKDPTLAELRRLSIHGIAQRIGAPTTKWPGSCFAIASSIVEVFQWKDATAAYGAYLGPIAPGSHFSTRAQGMVRHGWILTREQIIIDPTAWVFENTEPYLKVLQPGDDLYFACHRHYDEGAESMIPDFRPFPPQASDAKLHRIDDPDLAMILNGFINARAIAGRPLTMDTFTAEQMHWVCSTPYTTWGAQLAHRIYAQAEAMGLSAVIPVDFKRRAQREREWQEPIDAAPPPRQRSRG